MEEEVIATAEDEHADPTHSPYEAGNENRDDIAVDGFWKHGRQCRFVLRTLNAAPHPQATRTLKMKRFSTSVKN